LEGHGILVSADELSVSIEAKSVSDLYHTASTFAAMIETSADSVDLPNDENSTPARHSASGLVISNSISAQIHTNNADLCGFSRLHDSHADQEQSMQQQSMKLVSMSLNLERTMTD